MELGRKEEERWREREKQKKVELGREEEEREIERKWVIRKKEKNGKETITKKNPSFFTLQDTKKGKDNQNKS